jgi:predicted lipoprotein with Yx(FWY)xxD motif
MIMDRVVHRTGLGRVRILVVVAALLGALVLSGLAIAGTVKSLAVAKRTVSGKSETIVVDNRGVTVYALGGESLAKLECVMRTCFNIWQPLRVPSASTKVTAGKGVPGKVGVFRRVKGGFYQLMLDRHPLYYFSGDKGKSGKVLGQGIKSFGGTWHVVTS